MGSNRHQNDPEMMPKRYQFATIFYPSKKVQGCGKPLYIYQFNKVQGCGKGVATIFYPSKKVPGCDELSKTSWAFWIKYKKSIFFDFRQKNDVFFGWVWEWGVWKQLNTLWWWHKNSTSISIFFYPSKINAMLWWPFGNHFFTFLKNCEAVASLWKPFFTHLQTWKGWGWGLWGNDVWDYTGCVRAGN